MKSNSKLNYFDKSDRYSQYVLKGIPIQKISAMEKEPEIQVISNLKEFFNEHGYQDYIYNLKKKRVRATTTRKKIDRKKRIMKLISQGLTRQEIADIEMVNISAIYKFIKKYMPKYLNKTTPENKSAQMVFDFKYENDKPLENIFSVRKTNNTPKKPEKSYFNKNKLFLKKIKDSLTESSPIKTYQNG